ncbi:hypothetical protein GCM10027429_13770 [Marivirga atlantica]|uniref:PKD domain-containing protein n=1 Tax=Marivirga atlantica TaxID=1548457 RepID=A0A937DJ98_9BACT|nr:PKD domain-containing protein [Marivirga atlantica]MBL0764991.1 PKD domain-containing protein [Marivirga atlantica]
MNKAVYIKISSILALFFMSAFGASAQIQSSASEGCVPLSVQFSIDERNVQRYAWSFSNGQTAAVAEPSVLFEQSGTFDVSVEITYNDNSTATFTEEDFINVEAAPEIDFTVNKQIVCLGEAINFSNESSTGTHFTWNFGDGNQSNDENPTYIYNTAGNYNVSLRVATANGCESQLVKEGFIEVKDADQVEISASSDFYCLNAEPIQFVVSENVNEPLWNFGDGTTSSELNASHQFTKAGEYDISLQFTNNNGCTQSVALNHSIVVEESSMPGFSVSDKEICEYQSVILKTDMSDGQTYEWEISDGRFFQGKSVDVPFNEAGQYFVSLKVTNSKGCTFSANRSEPIEVKPANEITVNYNETEGCLPFTFEAINQTQDVIKTEWLINDEVITSNTLNYEFQEAGEYSISMRSYFENSCTIETELPDQISVLGEATEINVSKYTGCVPLEVEFSLLNEEATSVLWDFGNGTTAEGQNANITYENSGAYQASVSYMNRFGCEVNYELADQINALPIGINLGDVDTIQSCTFTEVYFSGDMGYDFWEWDFGDGNTSTEKNPVHEYAEAGVYHVSLSTNNRYGCKTTIENYNIIELPEIPIETNIEVSEGEACGYFSATLDATVGEGQQVSWQFDGATLAMGESAELSFLSNSNVSIVVRVTDPSGCSRSKSVTVKNPWEDCTNDDIQPGSDEIDENTGIAKLNIEGCNVPFSVDFVSPSNDASAVEWRFNDGSIITEEEFTHVFEETGHYTIDFYAEINKDSTVLIEDYVEVTVNKSGVDFNYEVYATCDGYSMTLTPTDTEMDFFLWELNNQEIQLSDDNTIFIENPGLYQVSLLAGGENICEANQVKNIFVGNEEHIFEYDPNLCLGEVFTVNQSLQGFRSFTWIINEEDSINTDQLEVEFNEAGSYKVELMATTADGCDYNFLVNNEIKVFDTKALFSTKGARIGCGALEVKFQNESTSAESVLWDFGNGETSEELNPTFTFEAGSYDITLIVQSAACSDTLVMENYIVVDELISDFNYSVNQNCLPVTVQFENKSVNGESFFWDFGNGDTSTEENPLYTFTDFPQKPVKLITTNANGCKTSTEKEIEGVFGAQFTADETLLCSPAKISFTSESEDAVEWLWNFGDGNSSSDENPSHIYQQAGSFDVSLIVTNAEGCSDTLSKVDFINVQELQSNFRLAEEKEIRCLPAEVSFINESIGASEFIWDFGDGETARVANPVHIYTKEGNYTVKLITKNSIGCTDTLEIENLVQTSGPETSFSVENKVVCLPNEISFTDESNNAVAWQWFFGDGSTSSEQNPSHQYQQEGYYKVTLLATNANGCEQTFSMDSIRAVKTPQVNFNLSVDGECAPVTITTENLSSNLQNPQYQWSIAGQSSNLESPVFTLTSPGLHEISLTIMNDGLCPVTYVYPEKILVRDTTVHEEATVDLIEAADYSLTINFQPYEFNNLKHYRVYRNSGSGFKLIRQLSADEADSFVDESVRPAENVYKYIFQAVDYCKDTVALDQLNQFNNLRLNRASEGTARYFNWNEHIGYQANNYRVFRANAQGDDWKELALLDISSNSFSDNEAICPGTYYYKVAAFYENEPLSISNIIEVSVQNSDIQALKATIKNTNVISNNSNLVEWTVPPSLKNFVAGYEVYRSVDGDEFVYHANVSAQEQIFIDEEVEASRHNYAYKIEVKNICEIDTESSEAVETILLTKEDYLSKYKLQWNQYTGWEEGVLKYLLQKENALGEWETIREIPADQTDVIINRE